MPSWHCVIRLSCVEIHRSAAKHGGGVGADDAVHAVAHALVVADLGDDDAPIRELVIGPDRAGNLLEVIVLHFDDGREMVIHAMSMRSQYRSMLDRSRDA